MARFTTAGGSGDGTPGATGPQGPAGNEGAQGPQGETGPLPFTYQGDFDYGVTYGTNDAVTFQGGLWKLNNFIGAAGYAPTPGQWTLIIPAGEQGPQGDAGPQGEPGTDATGGVVYLGNYISGNGYIANIAVVRGSDNNLYIAKLNGGLADPVGNSAEWDIFSDNTTGGGGSADLGDFVFTAGTATVNDNETILVQANNATTVKSQLVLDPYGIAKLQAFDNPDVVTFAAANPDWDSATWTVEPGIGSVINFVNAPNILNWISTSSQSVYNASMVINGVPAGTVNGFSYNGTDATLFINTTVPTEDPTVNEIGFSFITSSFIDINYDNGSLDIESNNMAINISSDDDVTITAGGDDLRLYANDDIRFISNYQNGGIEHNWRMNSEGGLEFPGSGLISNSSDSDDITISSNSGQFLNDSTIPGNQIATLDDIDESIANSNGNLFQSVRWTPNFTATGLTFTGSDATHPTYNSHYVKQGQLVSFWIAVDCSTVTSFGTGQLNLELPFAPLAGAMNHFSGWVFVDETANPDLAGHIIVNADHLPNTQTLDLHYIKQQGGANSPVMEAMLKQNTPVVLTTNTNIYVNGTYISA